MASTIATDAGERLVAGRWMLHTLRTEHGQIWWATEVATGRRLAVEQLRLGPADPAGQDQAALWERVAPWPGPRPS